MVEIKTGQWIHTPEGKGKFLMVLNDEKILVNLQNGNKVFKIKDCSYKGD